MPPRETFKEKTFISPKHDCKIGEGIRITIGTYEDMKTFTEKFEEVMQENKTV